MFWSLCYLAFRCVLRLVLLRPRSSEFKELEMVLLRHPLAVLRRQACRPQLTTKDRVFLAAASRLLPRTRWKSFLVTPTTLLRWHRRLVARHWTYAEAGVVGHRIGGEIRKFILSARARDPRWGYQQIIGELDGLGAIAGWRGWRRGRPANGWRLLARARARARGATLSQVEGRPVPCECGGAGRAWIAAGDASAAGQSGEVGFPSCTWSSWASGQALTKGDSERLMPESVGSL